MLMTAMKLNPQKLLVSGSRTKSLKHIMRYSVHKVTASLNSSILFAKRDTSGLYHPTKMISPVDVSSYTATYPQKNSIQKMRQAHIARRRTKNVIGIKITIHCFSFSYGFVPSSRAPHLSLKCYSFHLFIFFE